MHFHHRFSALPCCLGLLLLLLLQCCWLWLMQACFHSSPYLCTAACSLT
jgi:hypothetical protein